MVVIGQRLDLNILEHFPTSAIHWFYDSLLLRISIPWKSKTHTIRLLLFPKLHICPKIVTNQHRYLCNTTPVPQYLEAQPKDSPVTEPAEIRKWCRHISTEQSSHARKTILFAFFVYKPSNLPTNNQEVTVLSSYSGASSSAWVSARS